MPVESQRHLIHSRIAEFYHRTARILPWRAPPGGNARPDPYHVWLSEVMLQQTTVAAATPYFEKFTRRWPSLAGLAAADPADVLAAWAGLGYYSRARNLIACAGVVMAEHGGIFPDDLAALRALPGVGDYTAAAISAFAFGGNAVPLDANVERVVARLFAIDAPLPAGRRAILSVAQSLWPMAHKGELSGGDFAQALMDLGARICTARAPDCAACPLAVACLAHQQGRAAELPVKPPKRAKPLRHGRALWIMRDVRSPDAAVWLVRRPDKGMLGGMRALPGGEWGDAPLPAPQGARVLGTIRHVFTHFSLDLAVDHVKNPASIAALTVAEGEWWPMTRLDEAGLPTLYRRAAEIALGSTHWGE
jgi:A/G-specific adenine glycosylase